ncbi:MAG: cytochrome c [Betaproteobacteria bacterium]|nr:MAG: cytochrome c [Betaproteobacteria bacterium]
MQLLTKLFLGTTLAVSVSGDVLAQSPFARPEDAIKYRQSALFVMGQHFGRIGAVVKGERAYDKEEVARNASIAEQMSSLHWEAFAPGTDKGNTRARPEIWSNPAKFKSAADKMELEMNKLAVAAKAGELNAVKTQFGETGKACKACHDDFRKKE